MNERTNQPLVSVIVPVYNVEDYIEKCIYSIVEQTYKKLEVLIVDDGSTDNSGKICDKFEGCDYRLKVIHQKNGGLSAARNTGIDIANGEYIFFVDSDDYLELNIIEILVDEACKSNADMIAAGYERENIAGKTMGYFVPSDRILCTGIMGLRKHYQDKTNGMALVYAWGRLYKKKIFESLRYKERIKYEDAEIMPKIMMQIQTFVYLPIIGYHYIVRNNSISNNSDNFAHLYKDSFEIWEEHLNLYIKYEMKEFERYVRFLICEKIVSHYISNSIPKEFKELSFEKINENILKAMLAKLSIKRKIRLFFYWLLLEYDKK